MSSVGFRISLLVSEDSLPFCVVRWHHFCVQWSPPLQYADSYSTLGRDLRDEMTCMERFNGLARHKPSFSIATTQLTVSEGARFLAETFWGGCRGSCCAREKTEAQKH